MEIINAQTHLGEINQKSIGHPQQVMTAKLQFLLANFSQIIELEECLRNVLSENEIKKNPYLLLKLCDGGWLPFKEAFKL